MSAKSDVMARTKVPPVGFVAAIMLGLFVSFGGWSYTKQFSREFGNVYAILLAFFIGYFMVLRLAHSSEWRKLKKNPVDVTLCWMVLSSFVS